MKMRRTRVGLLRVVEEATLKSDPSQKAKAVRAMEQFIHALAVRDQKAVEKAAEALARLFLKLPTQYGVDD